jgi:hypothetical protein
MSDDVTASQILESQLREARAEAAGYRAHNEALQLQVVELNGELAAAETAIRALTALPRYDPETSSWGEFSRMERCEFGDWVSFDELEAALANAKKVAP